MSKKTMLVSVRLDRESYFQITNGPKALTAQLDRDQSWVINRAVTIGLLALGAGLNVKTPDDQRDAAFYAQAARLRELEMKDRAPLPVEATS